MADYKVISSSVRFAEFNFSIPSNWQKVSSKKFVILRNRPEEARIIEFINAGHQPWRLSAKNIASATLTDFGIGFSNDLCGMAPILEEEVKGKRFSIRNGNSNFIVNIRWQDKVPFPESLELDTIGWKK